MQKWNLYVLLSPPMVGDTDVLFKLVHFRRTLDKFLPFDHGQLQQPVHLDWRHSCVLSSLHTQRRAPQ